MVVNVIIVCLFCIIFTWIICECSNDSHSNALLQAIAIIHQRINELERKVKDYWKVMMNMERHIEEIDEKIKDKKGN